MSSLNSLISYGDSDGDGYGYGFNDDSGQKDLVDFELEYVGNKINGGVLSFYEDEDEDEDEDEYKYKYEDEV